MDRREFLKKMGATTMATSTIVYAKSINKATGGLDKLVWPDNEPTDNMTKRTFPNIQKPVSLLGYGGMRWPTKKNDDGKRMIDQEKVESLIDYAMKHGVNYYDTAPVYHGGASERAMGKALSRYPRESFQIATKLSNFNPSQWNLEAAKKMYSHSMEELGVDYIDFYLLHSLDKGRDAFLKRFAENGILDFLQEERKQGRIRHLGFSFHGDRESFLTALDYPVKWDFVQIQLNYFDWIQDSDERPSAQYMYSELEKRGIPVVVMEPLLGGRLAKLDNSLLEELKKRDPEKSPASWAFRFVGSLPQIMTTLSGMTYQSHLTENINVFSPLVPITEADKTFLEETAVAMMKHPVIPCTACRYCMPCPFGVDIPGNFAYFNKQLLAGQVPASKQSTNYAKARKRFLADISKSVKAKAQSVNCTACGHCLPQCPQHIQIPDQMKRINKLIKELKNS